MFLSIFRNAKEALKILSPASTPPEPVPAAAAGAAASPASAPGKYVPRFLRERSEGQRAAAAPPEPDRWGRRMIILPNQPVVIGGQVRTAGHPLVVQGRRLHLPGREFRGLFCFDRSSVCI